MPDQFELYFDSSPVAHVVTDRAGTIRAANRAALVRLGADAVSAEMEAVRDLREGEVANTSLHFRGADGTAVGLPATAIAVGDSILWALPASDLLDTPGRALETLVDELPIGVVVVSRGGQVLRANRRMREVLGAPEAVGQLADWLGDLRYLDGTHVPAADRPLARALHGERTASSRFLRADRALEITAAPFEGGAVLLAADVTEEVHRERAEHEFVSNAAHQIRTPITIISSVVGALHAGGRDDPHAMRRFLDHIDGAVARLSRLADALLTLARVQDGTPLRGEIVRLGAVIDDALDGRDVLPEVEDGVAALADASLLVETIANLVDNAFVHGAPPVEIAAFRVGTAAVVEIRDRGPGISPSDRHTVFERFVGKGTGLGLAVARESVAAMSGSLELEDRAGGGLVVRVTLPGARIL